MEKINSGGSSIRRRSLSISSHISHHTDNDDAECESVSEAGDIGDRVTIRSKRISESSSSFRLSFDNRSENEAVVSIPEEHRLHPNSVRPLPPALTSEDTKHVSSLPHLIFISSEIFGFSLTIWSVDRSLILMFTYLDALHVVICFSGSS